LAFGQLFGFFGLLLALPLSAALLVGLRHAALVSEQQSLQRLISNDANVAGHLARLIPPSIILSRHNVELLSALNHALDQNPGRARFLYLGETGSGKSHVLQGAVQKAAALAADSVRACSSAGCGAGRRGG